MDKSFIFDLVRTKTFPSNNLPYSINDFETFIKFQCSLQTQPGYSNHGRTFTFCLYPNVLICALAYNPTNDKRKETVRICTSISSINLTNEYIRSPSSFDSFFSCNHRSLIPLQEHLLFQSMIIPEKGQKKKTNLPIMTGPEYKALQLHLIDSVLKYIKGLVLKACKQKHLFLDLSDITSILLSYEACLDLPFNKDLACPSFVRHLFTSLRFEERRAQYVGTDFVLLHSHYMAPLVLKTYTNGYNDNQTSVRIEFVIKKQARCLAGSRATITDGTDYWNKILNIFEGRYLSLIDQAINDYKPENHDRDRLLLALGSLKGRVCDLVFERFVFSLLELQKVKRTRETDVLIRRCSKAGLLVRAHGREAVYLLVLRPVQNISPKTI